jgi:transcription elongation factor Elf1
MSSSQNWRQQVIQQSCFKCKRRFALDPVLVGFELSKLKKKHPNFYQATCPACRAVNKVSIKQMQPELDAVADQVTQMYEEYKAEQAKVKAEKQAARQKEKNNR